LVLQSARNSLVKPPGISTQVYHATFEAAILTCTDFARAKFGYTKIIDVDLSSAQGLETVRHMSPSAIDIGCLYKSKGRVPKLFLRGAGVPEAFINFTRTLVEADYIMETCFLSHSSKDKGFCDKLFSELERRGVVIWYFPENAKWGNPVWSEIDKNIKIHDRVIVVCSRNSLQSGPVLREIERALVLEDQYGRNVLFPIQIDDYLFKEWQHP
jgi:hypothetical protein